MTSKKKEECKILTSDNGKRTLLMLQTHLRRLYNLRIQYILLFIYNNNNNQQRQSTLTKNELVAIHYCSFN